MVSCSGRFIDVKILRIIMYNSLAAVSCLGYGAVGWEGDGGLIDNPPWPSELGHHRKVHAAYSHVSTKLPEHTLKALSTVYEMNTQMKIEGRPSQSSIVAPIAHFIDQCQIHPISAFITNFVRFIAKSPDLSKATAGFMSMGEMLSGSLPPKANATIDSIKRFRQVMQTIAQIKNEKTYGVLTITNTIIEGGKCGELFGGDAVFKEAMDNLKTEWNVAFDEALRASSLKAVADYLKKYTKEMDMMMCISGWSFDKCQWITRTEDDPVRNAELSVIEPTTRRYSTNVRTMHEVLSKTSQLTWATEIQKKTIKSTHDKLKKAELDIQNASLMLGSIMLTNAVLTNTMLEPAEKFVTEKLRVEFRSLPGTLQDKVTFAKKGLSESVSAGASTVVATAPSDGSRQSGVPKRRRTVANAS